MIKCMFTVVTKSGQVLDLSFKAESKEMAWGYLYSAVEGNMDSFGSQDSFAIRTSELEAVCGIRYIDEETGEQV